MKRLAFLSVFVLISLLSFNAFAQQNKANTAPVPRKFKALFIGNSFTFCQGGVNNLVAAMVNTAPGYKMIGAASTQGGYNLAQHSDPEDPIKTVAKIKSQKWNVIVLQDHSIFAIAQRDAMIEGGCAIHKLILEHSPATQVVLYETWARGPYMLEGFGEDEQKKTEMIQFYNEKFGLRTRCAPVLDWLKDGIHGGYAQLKEAIDKQADEFNAKPENKIKAPHTIVVPAGSYWELSKKANPDINLYYTDNYHQSAAGNYLTGLIFYKTLTGQNKISGMYKRLAAKRIKVGISAQDAAKLEKIAEETLE